jgi:hypothetical protein
MKTDRIEKLLRAIIFLLCKKEWFNDKQIADFIKKCYE